MFTVQSYQINAFSKIAVGSPFSKIKLNWIAERKNVIDCILNVVWLNFCYTSTCVFFGYLGTSF